MPGDGAVLGAQDAAVAGGVVQHRGEDGRRRCRRPRGRRRVRRSSSAGEQRNVPVGDDDGAAPAGGRDQRVQCVEGRLDGAAGAGHFVLVHDDGVPGPAGRRGPATRSRSCRTTRASSCGVELRAAASAWPTMDRPPISCRIFGVRDFIRVPAPAARTITAAAPMPWSADCSAEVAADTDSEPTDSSLTDGHSLLCHCGLLVADHAAADPLIRFALPCGPHAARLRSSAHRIRTYTPRLQRPGCCRYTRADHAFVPVRLAGRSIRARFRAACAQVSSLPWPQGCSRTGRRPRIRSGRPVHDRSGTDGGIAVARVAIPVGSVRNHGSAEESPPTVPS